MSEKILHGTLSTAPRSMGGNLPGQVIFGVQGPIGPTGPQGPEGPKGEDGRGIISTKRTSGTGAPGTTDTYTITYNDGTTDTFTVYNGANGTGSLEGGVAGEDGATFTPYVDAEGNLSWSNDKGLSNPETVNIKGPRGEKGADGATGPQGPAYTLTSSDKAAITQEVIAALPVYNGEVTEV